MHRCLQLAALGARARPNPMVGAVLVHNNKIIGEGYHEQYGKAHAEVNCINNVSAENKQYIHKSTLYVSLEPCSHFGKTPPCTDLIIDNKIPVVVIAGKDNFSEVNGKGVQQLQQAGIMVIEGVLEHQAIELNKAFFISNNNHRPYIILKWAQSKDGKIANADFSATKITNAFTDVLVHKWRSQAGAILIGKRTALHDRPELTTRYWKGENPLRLIIDPHLSLPIEQHFLYNKFPTVIFNYNKSSIIDKIKYELVEKQNVLSSVIDYLYDNNISVVLIEGGAFTLQAFIDAGLWDEARVITNTACLVGNGIEAPVLKASQLVNEENIYTDTIQYFIKQDN